MFILFGCLFFYSVSSCVLFGSLSEVSWKRVGSLLLREVGEVGRMMQLVGFVHWMSVRLFVVLFVDSFGDERGPCKKKRNEKILATFACCGDRLAFVAPRPTDTSYVRNPEMSVRLSVCPQPPKMKISATPNITLRTTCKKFDSSA